MLAGRELMILGDAIYARLKAHAGTLALVNTRIYPLRLPQGPTYPAIRYQLIGAPETHLMGNDPGSVHSRVQIDCYAETYRSAHLLKAEVRDALSRWEGTVGGVVVDHLFLDDWRDMEEPTLEHDGEQGIYRVMMDLVAHYSDDAVTVP